MSREHPIWDPLNSAYPLEMRKFLASKPEHQQGVPDNPGISTETLLISFFAATETMGAVEAYDTCIRAETRTVIDFHNQQHRADERHPKGATYIWPAARTILDVLIYVREQAGEMPSEPSELKNRIDMIEAFRNNPENQPPAPKGSRRKIDPLAGTGTKHDTRKRKNRR